MIPQVAIDLLIRVGTSSREADPIRPSFSELEDFPDINVKHWSEWNRVTRRLDVENQQALLRGSTIAERAFEWSGGSVAASIWVWRSLYENADRATAKQAAEWVVSHTSNPYAPYGTTRHACFETWEHEQSEEYEFERSQRQLRLADEAKQAIRRKQRRVARRRREHSARLQASHRRREERKAYLLDFHSRSTEERLRSIAKDWTRTIDYWPTTATDVSQAELRELPLELLELLLKRLTPRCLLEWRNLRCRIRGELSARSE